ncbi:hypothetical protein NHQ30_005028 [Ciborinia camelliae]|nr:hypothetical protein NHQ30_005028 [Ciborinia camelliae]
MYAFKNLSFAFLLLAASVQAGKITYTCKDNTGGVDKTGRIETKAGGRIPDDQDQVVVDGMSEWSDGQFTASIHERTKTVIVKCVEGRANKNLATTANNEQEQLVNSHITKSKRQGTMWIMLQMTMCLNMYSKRVLTAGKPQQLVV